MEFAIELGAIDVSTESGNIEIITKIENFNEIREGLEKSFGENEQAEIIWNAESFVVLDEKNTLTLLKLLEALDNCEDVQNVFGNFDLNEDIVKNLNY